MSNSRMARIFNLPSGFASPWLGYRTVYAVAALTGLCYLLASPHGLEPASLAGLALGASLTPSMCTAIVVVQWLLFILAIPLMGRTALMITGSPRWAFAATALYSLIPGINQLFFTVDPLAAATIAAILLSWVMVKALRLLHQRLGLLLCVAVITLTAMVLLLCGPLYNDCFASWYHEIPLKLHTRFRMVFQNENIFELLPDRLLRRGSAYTETPTPLTIDFLTGFWVLAGALVVMICLWRRRHRTDMGALWLWVAAMSAMLILVPGHGDTTPQYSPALPLWFILAARLLCSLRFAGSSAWADTDTARPSGYRSPLLSYTCIYILYAATAIICFCWFGGGVNFYDTLSYREAWLQLSAGSLDAIRTPVYPLFYGLCHSLVSMPDTYWLMTGIQWLLYGVAIHYFRLMSSLLLRGRRAVFWATALFALLPGLNQSQHALLSEGLMMPTAIFTYYWLVRTGVRPTVYGALMSAFWLLVSVALRPAALLLLPLAAVYCVGLYRQYGRPYARAFYAGGCALCAVVALVAAYCLCINRQYGLKSPTVVSSWNNYIALREYDAIHPEDMTDPAEAQVLEGAMAVYGNRDINQYWAWKELEYLRLHVSPATLEHIVSDAVAANRSVLPRATYHNMTDKFNRAAIVNILPAFTYDRGHNLWSLDSPFDIDLKLGMLLMLAALCLQLRGMRRRHRLSWPWLLVFAIPFGQMFVIAAGAYGDYVRLFAPAAPLVIIIFVWLASHMQLKPIQYYD